MNSMLESNARLFAQNREAMKNAFKWQNNELILLGAAMITVEKKIVTIDQLKEIEMIVKSNENIFSMFRTGNIKTAIIAKMIKSKNPEQYLLRVKKISDILNGRAFFDSEFAAIAAMILVDREEFANTNENIAFDMNEAIEYTNEAMRIMKEQHPLITTKEDLPYAAMLAISDYDLHDLLNNAEECMQEIKDLFGMWTSDAAQSIGQVLALSEKTTEEKCKYTHDVWKKCKDLKKSFGKDKEICVLATGNLLDLSASQFVQDIYEVDEFLATLPNMSIWSLSSHQRHMYAAMIVLMSYLPESVSIQSAIISSTVALIITQQILMASIAASSAANAASHH